jgi:hypothetical protein
MASLLSLLQDQSLPERIEAAIKHAEAHEQMNSALWPHQWFALTTGELLLAARRGLAQDPKGKA